MGQFSVYRNRNSRTRATFPLLLDIQSDLLEELDTRVVVPLTKAPALTKRPMSIVAPIIDVGGEAYLLLTPQLAGVAKSILGAFVTDVAEQRTAIVAALDLLVTGV